MPRPTIAASITMTSATAGKLSPVCGMVVAARAAAGAAVGAGAGVAVGAAVAVGVAVARVHLRGAGEKVRAPCTLVLGVDEDALVIDGEPAGVVLRMGLLLPHDARHEVALAKQLVAEEPQGRRLAIVDGDEYRSAVGHQSAGEAEPALHEGEPLRMGGRRRPRG